MGRVSKTSLLLSALLLASCASVPRETLGMKLDRLAATPPLQHAVWGVLVEDDAGRVLYERNARVLMMPASNRKLFASATVATCLGFDGQLATEIWRDGDDLVVRGGADPSLGSWRYGREDDFDLVANKLRARGIARVHDVVADVSLFDRVTIPGSWKHGNIGSDYAAPVDAIAWGENEIPVNRAVPDAALHAAETLRAALFARGIEVTGVARAQTEPRVWQERLLSLPSPFIGHLLQTVLKNSHNLYTEMLLKFLGAPSYDRAFAVERQFLTTEVRVPPDEFRFVDGSGLAPDDLVTGYATIRMLRWMNDPARRAMWWSLLATPNQEGTLRSRLVPLEHRLRGKTGSINGVNALSGIIRGANGDHRYFAIVVNHHLAADALKTIDAMVEQIAAF